MQSKHGTGGNHEIFKGQSVQESRCEMSKEIETTNIERVENCIDCPKHSEYTEDCYLLERAVEPQGIDPDCPYPDIKKG